MNIFKYVGFLLFLFHLPTLSANEKAHPIFETDIQPLLKRKCVRCHSGERNRANLDLSTLQGVFKGGESGPVIVPKDVEKSLLYEKVHKGEMPPNRELSKEQVELIHHWIESGAKANSEIVQRGPEVTQHQIEPLMRLRCTACHGLRKQEAGLDLRSKSAMLKGGKSGPAIRLGKPEESLILKKIHAEEMPPRNKLIIAGVKPMQSHEIEMLAKWIKLDAPEVHVEPDVANGEVDPLITESDRQFWAFQTPRKPVAPKLNLPSIRNPIDAFILRKLQENHLTLSPKAERLTLLRRAYFDLLGLPPTPEEVQQFIIDTDPLAYEKLIERLLASPRYGERWARYWLDVAGYADSEGKRSADPIRPHAWRYRDYVIRAFNSGKPYDRFLLEQIAGDELADYQNSEITPEIMDNLIATGFLRMAPDGTGSDVVNYVPERLEVISDQLQVFGSGVLGLTIHCARCHSHKYDPIPQRDYYRLMDVFKGAYDEHDWLKPSFVRSQTKSKKPGRVLSHISKEEQAVWDDYVKELKVEIEKLKKKKQDRDVRLQLRTLEAVADEKPMIRALWDRGVPSPTYLYRRGDYLQPGTLVGPGSLSVLTSAEVPFEVEKPSQQEQSTGRRLALAKWLVDPEHPLTSRVMVNRVWKHHFGRGIVETLSNFGKTGARPTHPELLDWLAREFVESGWSIKHLHRLMMTSATYRQSSAVTGQHEKLDPENKLLSRMPLQRMGAEVLRDSLLMMADELDTRPFGPPDYVHARKDGLVTSLRGKNGWRRSIFILQRRSQVPTLLENFDLPQMNPNCIHRVDSTVASQALHLMNNAMIEQLAKSFAQRLIDEVGHDSDKQIKRAYLIALNRPVSDKERQMSQQALRQFEHLWRDHLAESSQSVSDAKLNALTSWCHTLMNSAALLYVD